MVDPDDKYEKRFSAETHKLQQGFLAVLVAFCLLLAGLSYSHPVVLRKTPNTISMTTPYAGMKILYIVTTLSEYDNGSRNTVRGFDRMQSTLIPVVRESVESMISFGFQVDVVLICHYEMTREHLVREALPESVGLQVWDEATPLGYKLEDKNHNDTAQAVTRALARQHRYVIKDKFAFYDFFVNFEDDMLIKGGMVENFMEVTQELYRLRQQAPENPPPDQFQAKSFYGVMTKSQLQRMIPGFVRVEVLLDEEKYGAQETLDEVPVTNRPRLDPSECCHLQNPLTISKNRPPAPDSDKMVLWETNIFALGVRKLPLHSNIDWVAMQRGPLYKEKNMTIGDYWSGTDKYFEGRPDKKDRYRPHPKDFRFINNQGGWMASRHQIWEWHTELCSGGFLPPFESPHFNLDGLDTRNVEYWSGGMNIFTREHGCNLQRIISLDPKRFSRSLLYHTANNKQRQLTNKKERFTKANDLLGELNTVRKNAEAEMHRRVEAMSAALHHT